MNRPLLRMPKNSRREVSRPSSRSSRRQRQRERNELLLNELRRQAPAVWSKARPLPLAIGVREDLYPLAESLGLSRKVLRRFLAAWTSSPAYLRALSVSRASRVDALGKSVERVTAQDQAYAKSRLHLRTRN